MYRYGYSRVVVDLVARMETKRREGGRGRRAGEDARSGACVREEIRESEGAKWCGAQFCVMMMSLSLCVAGRRVGA